MHQGGGSFVKKRRFELNEKQLGYAFVIPSLLLVCILILCLVSQSFWNSLFNYHVNDPTRSEKMIEEHIDLETYVDNHFYLESQLDDLASNAGDDAETIKALSKEIEDYQNELI